MKNNKVISGGCFCGKIRYEISGEILKAGICHCNACQHLTGGSSWPFIVVKKESLHIFGELNEYSRLADSGHKVHIGFCPECGTTLCAKPEIWPHIHTVSASSLDEPTLFSPTMQVWTEAAKSWALLNPETTQFSKNPTKANDDPPVE